MLRIMALLLRIVFTFVRFKAGIYRDFAYLVCCGLGIFSFPLPGVPFLLFLEVLLRL